MGACARTLNDLGASVLAGFTGSPIWAAISSYPQSQGKGKSLTPTVSSPVNGGRSWMFCQECSLKYAFEVHPESKSLSICSAPKPFSTRLGRPARLRLRLRPRSPSPLAGGVDPVRIRAKVP